MSLDPEVVAAALGYLRGVEVVLDPRRQWARGLDEPKGNIKVDERAEPGRALCREGDDGWWPVVKAALAAGEPSDELVTGVFGALKRWAWAERPTWVTWVPSSRGDALLAGLAERIASAGKLDVVPAVTRVREGRPQADLANGVHRLANVWGALAVDLSAVADPSGPVLLVDDRYDSGWTATVVASALRRAGSGPVLPFALVRV